LQWWVTTDERSNAIYSWDIVKEDIIMHLQSKEIEQKILSIVELVHLKLVAVSSMDKKISVWNFLSKTWILNIDLKPAGIHHLLYSYDY
jgi:hypothetical protein